MRGNKNVVLALVALLALAIVLPACGNGKGAANSDSSTASTGTATNTPAPNAADANAQAAPSFEVRYWRGQLDSGDTFLWMDDATTQTARIVLLEAHGEEESVIALEGPVATSSDYTEFTVTDNETQATFGFKVTSMTDTSIEIDAGEHGKGKLDMIAAEEFDAETGAYFAVVTEEPENTEQAPEEAPEQAPAEGDNSANEENVN